MVTIVQTETILERYPIDFYRLIRVDKIAVRVAEECLIWSQEKENRTSSKEGLYISLERFWKKARVACNEPPLTSGPLQKWRDRV
jgi:hypothetical protein